MFHLLKQRCQIQDMHFLLQKEVVDRLAAAPGEAAYGRLGIMMQYYCRVEALLSVPPHAFHPQPKVTSALVQLTPWRTPPYTAKDPQILETVVRTAFSARRKTLRNTLKPLLCEADIESIGIDSSVRAEKLSLVEFIALADYIFQHQQK
jgi:16S rRNA (adenine1518-N6/adenine1519-N6)-dimethyltransferase